MSENAQSNLTVATEITSIDTMVFDLTKGIKKAFVDGDFSATSKKIETSEDGTEVEYYVRKFELANPKKDLTALTVQNKDFIDSAEKILKVGEIKDSTNFVLYRELFKMSLTDVTEKTSFKSFNALASALFNIATPTVSLYVKVGKYFINDEYNVIDERLDGFKAGHFIELLPLVDADSEKPLSDIFTILNNGDITTLMPTKKIREFVQNYLNGGAEKSTEKKTNKKKIENSLKNVQKENERLHENLENVEQRAKDLSANNITLKNKLDKVEEALAIATDVSKMSNDEIINRILSDLTELKGRGIEVKGSDRVVKTLIEMGK